jgi:crotonobetainyl-CoA:carnitine CoA-transferase CaiB-like acyl-CoA transferase
MRLPPPRLGQHTDAVLQTDLGLTTDAVANLRQQRII